MAPNWSKYWLGLGLRPAQSLLLFLLSQHSRKSSSMHVLEKKGCGGQWAGPTAELVKAPHRGKGSRLQSRLRLMLGYGLLGSPKCKNAVCPVDFREVSGTWSCLGGSSSSLSGTCVPAMLSSPERVKCSLWWMWQIRGQPGFQSKHSLLVPVRRLLSASPPPAVMSITHPPGSPKCFGSPGYQMGEGGPYAIWRKVLMFQRDVLIIRKNERNSF